MSSFVEVYVMNTTKVEFELNVQRLPRDYLGLLIQTVLPAQYSHQRKEPLFILPLTDQRPWFSNTKSEWYISWLLFDHLMDRLWGGDWHSIDIFIKKDGDEMYIESRVPYSNYPKPEPIKVWSFNNWKLSFNEVHESDGGYKWFIYIEERVNEELILSCRSEWKEKMRYVHYDLIEKNFIVPGVDNVWKEGGPMYHEWKEELEELVTNLQARSSGSKYQHAD